MRRRGLTLAESVVAMTILSVLGVAAVNTLAAARLDRVWTRQYATAHQLAEAMMAEILEKPYADPEVGVGSFGLDAGELGSDRLTFDDVDDYEGWTSSPPKRADGASIAGATGYTRAVRVVRVTLANPRTTSATETGLKCIVVDVGVGSERLVRLYGLRSAAWRATGEE